MKSTKDNGGLGFNGMTNGNNGGYSKKYQTNASGRTAKENYGRGPTKGNTDGKVAGAPTAKGGKINGGTKVPKCSYNINVGRGPTVGNQQ